MLRIQSLHLLKIKSKYLAVTFTSTENGHIHKRNQGKQGCDCFSDVHIGLGV